MGPQILVGDDDLPEETDQFMPQITVDDEGFIHMIYFSDEQYPDQVDGGLNPKFDAFYRRGQWVQGQLQFGPAQELCRDPDSANQCGADDRAVDGSLFVGTNYFLRDYNGIDWSGDRIWTSFMGLSAEDTRTDKSVIFSTQILRQ